MRMRLLLLALLFGAFPAGSEQGAAAERTVELVFASSERQARVAARAMRTDFFVDQLLIPDTSYAGRHAWSKLNAGIRDTLADAQPGEVYLFTLASGNHLVARVLPEGTPAVLGDTQFAKDSQEIWAVLSVGPTDSRLLSMEVDVETEDLAGICRSKQQLIEDELRSTRAEIAALPPDAGPQQLVEPYGDLISLHSYQGDMARAR